MHGLESYLFSLIYHYRYQGLFLVLSLGMIGLPVPDEFIMAFSGFQTTTGHMSFVETLFFASIGSFVGMNLSYWIGRTLGVPFLHRIAHFFHLDENKYTKVEGWFRKFGDRLILIGYFFPGFRHFVAYFSGISKLNYARYSFLSGIGATLWSSTFITLGHFLGVHWQKVTYLIHRYLLRGGVILVLMAGIVYLWLNYRNKTKMTKS